MSLSFPALPNSWHSFAAKCGILPTCCGSLRYFVSLNSTLFFDHSFIFVSLIILPLSLVSTFFGLHSFQILLFWSNLFASSFLKFRYFHILLSWSTLFTSSFIKFHSFNIPLSWYYSLPFALFVFHSFLIPLFVHSLIVIIYSDSTLFRYRFPWFNHFSFLFPHIILSFGFRFLSTLSYCFSFVVFDSLEVKNQWWYGTKCVSKVFFKYVVCRCWLYVKYSKGLWKVSNCDTACHWFWQLIPLFGNISKRVWQLSNDLAKSSTSLTKSSNVRPLYSNACSYSFIMWLFCFPPFLARLPEHLAIPAKFRSLSANVWQGFAYRWKHSYSVLKLLSLVMYALVRHLLLVAYHSLLFRSAIFWFRISYDYILPNGILLLIVNIDDPIGVRRSVFHVIFLTCRIAAWCSL